jgi:hypothetical protein
MVRRLRDFSPSELSMFPKTSVDLSSTGEETIYLHLFNRKKMNWYLAGYSSISRKFFGYFENPSDTMTSGFYTLEDILSYGRKGEDWEPIVDESWKPMQAKDIPLLHGYVEFIRNGTDDFT